MKTDFMTEYTESFAVSKETQDKLEIYKLLKWNASFFLGAWNSNINTCLAGTIIRYGKMFHVSFDKGLSLDLLKRKLHKEEFKVRLSFRKAKNLPAYVIVNF